MGLMDRPAESTWRGRLPPNDHIKEVYTMKQLVLLAMLGMLMLSLSFGQGETASMKTYRKEKYQDVLLIMTAARTGIAKAQHALGEMYQNGTHGVPVNHVEALK